MLLLYVEALPTVLPDAKPCCNVSHCCLMPSARGKMLSEIGAGLVSLIGFNDAFNTIRLYKRPAQGCVQRSCQGITTLNLLSSLDY